MPKKVNPYRDQAMKDYFNSLPAYVQETIMQSGPELESVEDLKACAQGMLEGSNNKANDGNC